MYSNIFGNMNMSDRNNQNNLICADWTLNFFTFVFLKNAEWNYSILKQVNQILIFHLLFFGGKKQ